MPPLKCETHRLSLIFKPTHATGAGGGGSGIVGSPGSVGCSLGVSGPGWPGMPPTILNCGCSSKDQASNPTLLCRGSGWELDLGSLFIGHSLKMAPLAWHEEEQFSQ